jgi:hypothetical protein
MPGQNPNDNTSMLGPGGDVISDEYLDPNQPVRREGLLPPGAYKLPRSKIAVGPYGQDWGDASADLPLQVESRAQRQLAELDSLRTRQATLQAMARYAGETISLSDARGSFLDTRGQR